MRNGGLFLVHACQNKKQNTNRLPSEKYQFVSTEQVFLLVNVFVKATIPCGYTLLLNDCVGGWA